MKTDYEGAWQRLNIQHSLLINDYGQIFKTEMNLSMGKCSTLLFVNPLRRNLPCKVPLGTKAHKEYRKGT